jgi:uncharacterized protein involved in exopolysaccharide biosynthesis
MGDESIDLVAQLRKTIRHKGLIAACIFLGAGLSAWLAFRVQPEWESISRILPSTSAPATSQLSGLASLAGIQVDQGMAWEEYYQDIALAPNTLDSILLKRWPARNRPEGALLEELVAIEIPSSGKQLAHVPPAELRRFVFHEYLKSRVMIESGTTFRRVVILAPDPLMAQAINQWMLRNIEHYINVDRQTTSARQVVFIETRLKEYDSVLTQAEGRLRWFEENNREVASPVLRLSNQRLQREVNIYTSVVMDLRQKLETARIEREREKHHFMVFEAPSLPFYKVKPKRRKMVVTGVVAGAVAGLACSFLLAWWRDNREDLILRWKASA